MMLLLVVVVVVVVVVEMVRSKAMLFVAFQSEGLTTAIATTTGKYLSKMNRRCNTLGFSYFFPPVALESIIDHKNSRSTAVCTPKKFCICKKKHLPNSNVNHTFSILAFQVNDTHVFKWGLLFHLIHSLTYDHLIGLESHTCFRL